MKNLLSTKRALLLFLFTAAVNQSLAAAGRPNILLAIADDWSYGHAGAYNCKWVRTPHFDRIAKEGLLFTHAFTPNAKCAPSRATILTGRYSWQLEEAGNHFCFFPAKFGSYVERLAAAGYATGFTGKGWAPGVAKDATGNRRKITGTSYSARRAKPPAKGISNNDYAANFADFLRDVPDGQPWAFWYGTTEPHRAYEFQSGVRLGKSLDDIDRVPGYWPDNEVIRHDMLDYAIEVEHYDAHLGRILDHLEQAGQLDNTLVVATSDHGMPFPRVKGQAYAASNHIPLAIRWPEGIESPGRVIDVFVNFADLAPTFLEVASIREPGPIMQTFSGRSLWEVFRQVDSRRFEKQRDHVLIGKERHDVGRPNDGGYPIRGIIQQDWLFLQNFCNDRWPAGNPETGYLNCDGSPTKTDILERRRRNEDLTRWNLCFGKRPDLELYNLAQDPDCISNLAAQPEFRSLVQNLQERMRSELKKQGDPRMQDKGEIFDNYPYADSQTAHFYERYHAGENIRATWVHPSDFEPAPLQ